MLFETVLAKILTWVGNLNFLLSLQPAQKGHWRLGFNPKPWTERPLEARLHPQPMHIRAIGG